MIELEKMCASTAKNPCNLGAYWIIEISLSPPSAYLISRDQDKFVFYVNKYINWDQFSKFYNLDWMEKDI